MDFGDTTLTLGQTIGLLSPEILLLVAGLLILGLDAIFPHEEERDWLPQVALLGLVVALIATFSLWGWNARVLAVLFCDPFALMVKVIALVAMGIVVLSSDVYIRVNSRYQGEFYALLLFATMTICLLGATTNLIMLFLTFDFLSIISYILTGYLRGDKRSTEAAIKYFLYGATISAVMLYGMSWFYGLTGSTDLSGIAAVLRGGEYIEYVGVGEDMIAVARNTLQPVVLPALVMMAAGFAFKIGAVPFHQWAPDAYEGAPTPVTAFLSVCPKVAGFAVILRVLLTGLSLDMKALSMDWRTLLMAISVLTMTFGNLVALWQQNIKRLLAYSSIAQAGYILIGVVSASERGTTAVLLYLAAYALTNLGAFAVIIAFSNQTGSDDIEDYAGLSQRSPGLALIMMVCLLSLGGIPPTAGFVGKLWLFSAAIDKGLYLLAVVGVLNSVISLAYYWKIMRAMYFTPAQTDEHVSTSPALAVALGVAVVGVFAVGLFPGPLLGLLQAAAQTFFAG